MQPDHSLDTEARQELDDVRTNLEDMRSILDGPMEGTTPPDWSLADLAEAVAHSAAGTRRSRDEAREALRDLLAAIDTNGRHFVDGPLARAMADAERLLSGVERTHALVPVEALKRAADYAHGVIFEYDAEGRAAEADARRFEAAARGERVEWPA